MRFRKVSAWLAGALCSGVVFGSSLDAAAQVAVASGTTGFALQRFTAAPAGDRFFGVPSPYASGDPAVHVALLLDYASNPLLLSRIKGNTEAVGVVTDQMHFHVDATFAIFDRLALNIDVPAAVLQDGVDPVYRGAAYGSPHAAAFGDVRLGLRARLFGDDRALFQLGLEAFVWAPTGSRADYTGDGQAHGMPRLLLGGFHDRFVWSFSGGAHLRPSTTLNDVTISHSVELGAGFGFRLGDRRNVQIGPELTVGIATEDLKRRNTHAELLLGAKYRITPDIEAGLAAGPGLTPGYGTPDGRFIASIAFTPERHPAPAAAADTDKDGIPDDKDLCPQQPQGDRPDARRPGCPAAPDKDGDGIADAEDACQDVAGVASADAAKNGCPADSDGDGVIDAQDKCPDKAQGDKPDPMNLGCPLPPDSDGDGVLDRDDACPTLAGIASADRAQNGCPGDTDGDAIRDDVDACPEVKGPKDNDPQKNGCPKIVRFIGSEIVILQQVQFATGTAKLTGNSDEILSEVATVLKDHAEILKLEIQGHTDNKGNKAANKVLSQSRAESVLKAIVTKGVAAERLSAKGYGQEVTIADNATEEGRAKNRRVQFKILEKKKK